MAGRTVHLPGTKGLHDLRLLMSQPRAEVLAARRLSSDDVLDDEIDQATSRDDDRTAELDQERAGLSVRTRRLGDEAERARKTVTARIRDTLTKLDQRHSELATHLRATISPGTTCRYDPAETITWCLQTD